MIEEALAEVLKGEVAEIASRGLPARVANGAPKDRFGRVECVAGSVRFAEPDQRDYAGSVVVELVGESQSTFERSDGRADLAAYAVRIAEVTEQSHLSAPVSGRARPTKSGGCLLDRSFDGALIRGDFSESSVNDS